METPESELHPRAGSTVLEKAPPLVQVPGPGHLGDLSWMKGRKGRREEGREEEGRKEEKGRKEEGEWKEERGRKEGGMGPCALSLASAAHLRVCVSHVRAKCHLALWEQAGGPGFRLGVCSKTQ